MALKCNKTDVIELKINSYLDNLISCLNERRSALLLELKERREVEKEKRDEYFETVDEICHTKERLMSQHRLNRLKSFEETILSQCDKKLHEVDSQFSDTRINFEINQNDIEHYIANLGAIKEDPTFDYSTFRQPISAVGGDEDSPGELKWPQGVAYSQKTELIYIGDYTNACITLFNTSGEFMDRIKVEPTLGVYGVATHDDNMYVTGYNSHCVVQYSFSGPKFIRKVGTKGDGKNEFNTPTQLDVEVNGDVFVADFWNHRICVLNSKLGHNRYIKHETLINPCDVKISNSNLFVLTDTSPCLHLFTLAGEKITSLITKGPKMQVENTYFFCLDADSNILISDSKSHQMKVFNQKGNLIHTIGEPGDQKGMLNKPRGIALTKNNNLICVSQNQNFKLQIF